MIAVLPFCQKDYPAANRLLHWIFDLGGAKKYDCLLIADCGTQWSDCLVALEIANKAFRKASIITNKFPADGWIAGANSLFFEAAERIQRNEQCPWLWLEPDCVPLKPDWLDRISEEYQRCGKPFMGHIYNAQLLNLPRENLSGIAVYPEDAYSRLKPWRDSPLPFDIAISYKIVPEAHNTDLIEHVWGENNLPPTFAEWRTPASPVNTLQLSNIRAGAVLWHRNKDGTLIKLLRKRTNRILDLRNVTLWSIAWGHADSIRKIKRVLKYCQSIARFGETILFSTESGFSDSWTTVVVGCESFADFNRITNRLVPKCIKTEFAMSVQEDGFPIQPELWSEQFLSCDYIGAPWPDGVVGNGGFYIESQKMIQARMKLPDNPDSKPPMGNADWWLCRTNRHLLASQGIQFAPRILAECFSTECTGRDKPSFGFHGRAYNPEKYQQGWRLIQQCEK